MATGSAEDGVIEDTPADKQEYYDKCVKTLCDNGLPPEKPTDTCTRCGAKPKSTKAGSDDDFNEKLAEIRSHDWESLPAGTKATLREGLAPIMDMEPLPVDGQRPCTDDDNAYNDWLAEHGPANPRYVRCTSTLTEDEIDDCWENASVGVDCGRLQAKIGPDKR